MMPTKKELKNMRGSKVQTLPGHTWSKKGDLYVRAQMTENIKRLNKNLKLIAATIRNEIHNT